MSRLKWDQTGERKYETGTKQGVLYVQNGSGYNEGVVWNGLTAVTESPSGAEANDMWADNIKYGSLRSAETFGGTIEAYTYPEEFKPCNGENELIPGVSLGQQKRNPFAFSYVSDVGNDTPTEDDDGYKIHIIYNATASPAEKGYATVNDSPEAITFSWEISTTPIDVPGFKPTASLEIDTTNLSEYQRALGCLEEIEDTLYGTENIDATLMLPNEVADDLQINVLEEPMVEFTYGSPSNPVYITGITISDTSDLKNVVLEIPDGVITIGSVAGGGTIKVSNAVDCISMPDSVERIEPSAFYNNNFNTSRLKSIIFGNKIKEICQDAFMYATKLEYLEFKESANLNKQISIMDGAFRSCTSLKKINFGKNNKIYLSNGNNGVFENCTSLEEFTLESYVRAIPYRCCRECTSLKKVSLSGPILTIDRSAFYGCISLIEVKMPDTITNINNDAFCGCPVLRKLNLPSALTTIGTQAFASCNQLEKIKLPKSVTYIGTMAFYGVHCDVDLTEFDANETGFAIPVLSNPNAFSTGTPMKFYFKDQATLNAFNDDSNWCTYSSHFAIAS